MLDNWNTDNNFRTNKIKTSANIFYDKKQAKIEKITPQICAD